MYYKRDLINYMYVAQYFLQYYLCVVISCVSQIFKIRRKGIYLSVVVLDRSGRVVNNQKMWNLSVVRVCRLQHKNLLGQQTAFQRLLSSVWGCPLTEQWQKESPVGVCVLDATNSKIYILAVTVSTLLVNTVENYTYVTWFIFIVGNCAV